jgi:hypothetical protein
VNSILKDDDSGQFILLMSIIVAIGLVIILVFLNQSLMAGYSSSQSIMNFPKNDIRDFRSVTVGEASQIGIETNSYINSSHDTDPNAFNNTFSTKFSQFINQTEEIFQQQGTVVGVDYNNTVTPVTLSNNQTVYMGDNTTINLYYNNGETSYDDNTTVYFE